MILACHQQLTSRQLILQRMTSPADCFSNYSMTAVDKSSVKKGPEVSQQFSKFLGNIRQKASQRSFPRHWKKLMTLLFSTSFAHLSGINLFKSLAYNRQYQLKYTASSSRVSASAIFMNFWGTGLKLNPTFPQFISQTCEASILSCLNLTLDVGVITTWW